MKRMSSFISRFDQMVDQKMSTFWNLYKRYLPAFGVTLIAIMFAVIVWRSIRNKPEFIASTIHSDITRIATALGTIDKQCGIVRLVHDRNYVDFLTVVKFVGSEVGPLILAHPEKWKGPYLKDNPVVYDKLYEIVRAQDGFYVVPGYGVELPNGFIMGEDIVINHEVSVELLLKQGAALNYRNDLLAARIPFALGDWKDRVGIPKKLHNIEKIVEEFNEAMPYS